MIKDVSDVRRLPRLGKIHLGVKMTNEKGVEYPRAVDYFIVPEEVQKVYGEKPKKLKIILPSENPDVFFPQWYKKYSYGKGLICKGDGVTANRISPDDNSAMMEITCNKETCEDFLKGDCKPVANLLFILPDVPGFGVYQTDTSSYNNIINLNSEIALLKNLLGRISGIPLELTRETQEVIAKGKRQTVSLIHIRSPYSMNDLLKNAKQLSAPQEAAIEVPDNDIPESVPEEIGEGPPEDSEKVQPEPIIEEKFEQVPLDRDELIKEIYKLLKALGYTTFPKVTKLLERVFPTKPWKKIDQTVFQKMPMEDLEEVLKYLQEEELTDERSRTDG